MGFLVYEPKKKSKGKGIGAGNAKGSPRALEEHYEKGLKNGIKKKIKEKFKARARGGNFTQLIYQSCEKGDNATFATNHTSKHPKNGFAVHNKKGIVMDTLTKPCKTSTAWCNFASMAVLKAE